MANLLDIFAFLSVLLRAMTLAFEALTVGGVIFRFAIAGPDAKVMCSVLKFSICCAGLLAAAQLGYIAANSAILMASTNLTWPEVRGAEFCVSGALMIAGAGLVTGLSLTRVAKIVCPVGCVLILAGAVMSSHSMARLEHRRLLVALTMTHHLAGAAWIGGLPYLVLSLKREPDPEFAAELAGKFSKMATVSVVTLVGAGLAMSSIYIGSTAALTGTAYGLMVLAKIVLTGLAVTLGALNRKIVSAIRAGFSSALPRLRTFAEAEVGIGVTILMAAASLTSSPPAIDVVRDHVSPAEIAQRMAPRWPRMNTPPVADLAPATPLTIASNSVLPGSFVPGQQIQAQGPADIAWSEYNHHWAGLIVGSVGILSLLARRARWARHWPLAFLGLAVFLLVRADSENWPLGPRGFWESFQVAEVAQHRLFVLLIVAFAVFEWSVQTSRIRVDRAGLIFPAVCAAGGALLLTHSHSLGNIKEAFLAELSHTPLAILAVTAGWSRWLEIRVPPDWNRFAVRNIVHGIWPVCFISIGAILMNYREA